MSRSDSGWMDGDRFVQWMQHFIQCVKPSADRKVPFVLDGHKSRTKNLKTIEIASDNNVIMLSLPPHISPTKHSHSIGHFSNRRRRFMSKL